MAIVVTDKTNKNIFLQVHNKVLCLWEHIKLHSGYKSHTPEKPMVQLLLDSLYVCKGKTVRLIIIYTCIPFPFL